MYVIRLLANRLDKLVETLNALLNVSTWVTKTRVSTTGMEKSWQRITIPKLFGKEADCILAYMVANILATMAKLMAMAIVIGTGFYFLIFKEKIAIVFQILFNGMIDLGSDEEESEENVQSSSVIASNEKISNGIYDNVAMDSFSLVSAVDVDLKKKF
uniref:Uncharacterized protein n=1 Tax=Acrobeloides nanus TaxID=290746 RepID=A0A914EDV2_9BILA